MQVAGVAAKKQGDRRVPISPDKVVPPQRGVDVRFFDPTTCNEERFRRAFFIDSDELLGGMVGRISPAKGNVEFLQAAANIRTALPGIRFIAVGGASRAEDWCKQETEERGPGGRIGRHRHLHRPSGGSSTSIIW